MKNVLQFFADVTCINYNIIFIQRLINHFKVN